MNVMCSAKNEYHVFFLDGGPMNDVWSFDLTDTEMKWKWVRGISGPNADPSSDGIGVESNINDPSAAYGAASAIFQDPYSPKVFVFGGERGNAQYSYLSNCLWKFNPANDQWTLLTSLNDYVNQQSLIVPYDQGDYPGSRYFSAIAVDSNSNVYMLGGYGYSTSEWTDRGRVNLYTFPQYSHE